MEILYWENVRLIFEHPTGCVLNATAAGGKREVKASEIFVPTGEAGGCQLESGHGTFVRERIGRMVLKEKEFCVSLRVETTRKFLMNDKL